MVRCGACRTEFDVPGPGRYACPTCRATNEVRGGAPAAGGSPAGFGGPGGPGAPGAPGLSGLAGAGAPPPAPEPPPANVTQVACDECSFEFYVGEIALAVCPNCSAEVEVGAGEEA